MSEELRQTIPQSIGKYTYLKLGETTIKQLMENDLIPKRSYKGLLRKKPDGIVFFQKSVKAVVEYKAPEKLRSETDVRKAIEQELDVAKALCKILIVTDGLHTYWINALNGQEILDTKGNVINTTFDALNVKNVNILEYLIEEIDLSIDESNSCIRSYQNVDPTPLANKLWQTIWAATGKSPVKCLYNVVELFIFKFLSDLRVLPQDVSFENVYEKSLVSPEDALDYYARNTRVKIKRLFPKGADGTTIINGTIFVDENGNANLSQSYLFAYSLKHLQDYSEEFGSLTKISKQFKTKLYESFLKQEVEALGQYFTPRVIVQAVIRMAGLDDPTFSFRGKRICDKGRSPSEYNSVLWGIDGNFNFSTIPKGRKYVTTDHCGVIDILTDDIIPDYLLFALYEEKRNNDFDRSFRASLTNIKKFQIRIPIKEDGTFDIEEQNRIAADYRELCKRKERLDEAKAEMDNLLSHYTKL